MNDIADPVSSPSSETPPVETPATGTPPTLISSEPPKPEAPAPLTVESLKAPEGKELDPEVAKSLLDILNNGEMEPAARAQSLLDLHYDLLTKAAEGLSTEWESMQTKWQDQVRSDPDVGGENLDKSLAACKRLLNEYGTPELAEAFGITGAGNNVHFVKFLVKIEKALAEGSPAAAGNGVSAQQSLADLLYPTMKKG